MECQACGGRIPDNANFCSRCGAENLSEQNVDEVLDEAIAEAEAVFQAELESTGYEDTENIDLAAEDVDPTDETAARKKSARERFDDMRETVKKGTDRAKKIKKQVTESTSRAVKRTKEISGDVAERTSRAVDKTKKISGDVADVGVKVGKGVGKAVKTTKKSVEGLGRMGAIITERALDTVRASLRAIEIVGQYLDKSDSNYEVGNFKTGVGIPPYMEIEFTKKAREILSEESRVMEAFRKSGMSADEVIKLMDGKKTVKKKVVRKKSKSLD
jgi:hypothetical protein